MSGCVRIGLAVIAASLLASAPATAASAENGKVAFVKNGCWQCHGFEGQGSVATSGGRVLADTKLPFEAFKAFVRNSNGEMPPFREQMLSDTDLADIFAYLESLPPPRPPSEIPLLKQ